MKLQTKNAKIPPSFPIVFMTREQIDTQSGHTHDPDQSIEVHDQPDDQPEPISDKQLTGGNTKALRGIVEPQDDTDGVKEGGGSPEFDAAIEQLASCANVDRIDQQEDNLVVVHMSGKIFAELDVQELGSALHALAAQASQKRVILSCAGVEFLSSACLGKLLRWDRLTKKHAACYRLSDIRPEVMEVFTTTGLNTTFSMSETADVAYAELIGRPPLNSLLDPAEDDEAVDAFEQAVANLRGIEQVAVATEDDAVIVRFSGRLDERELCESIGEYLVDVVESIGGRYLVLSYKEVHFVSTAHLANLVTLQNALCKHSVQHRLCDMTPYIADVMHASRTNKLLSVAEDKTEDEALDQLRESVAVAE